MSQFGIPEEIYQQINNLFARYRFIKKVYLYGSRARGNFSPGSDIDLAVIGGNSDSRSINLLIDELECLDTVLSFDLIDLDRVKKEELKENVFEEGVVIYDRQTMMKRRPGRFSGR